MTKPQVELHPAHVWTCEECGRDNFCRGVTWEPDTSDERDMEIVRAAAGVDTNEELDGYTGFLITAPEEVQCSHCAAEYETVDSRGDSLGELN